MTNEGSSSILGKCEERTSKGTETKHGQSSVPFLILNFRTPPESHFAFNHIWLSRIRLVQSHFKNREGNHYELSRFFALVMVFWAIF